MINEQKIPTNKFDAREQGWSPKKPSCLGKLRSVVLGSETWYKCESSTPSEPEKESNVEQTPSENEFDQKISELETQIKNIKSDENYQKALEELNSLSDKIKQTVNDAKSKVAYQYKIWSLKQELNSRIPKDKPENVRSGIATDFKPCTGFNQLGCKSESIKKVQDCLNLSPTGNFDRQLFNELGRYGWQNGFNDSDVSRVCDLIKKTKETNIQIEKDRKEAEDFYKKFPKTTRGTEILDLT